MPDELVIFKNQNYVSWTLADAEIPMGPSKQGGTSFKKSDIDISCREGNLQVTYRYLGSSHNL